MLKKNNVAADVVSMGETDQNQVRLNRVGLVSIFLLIFRLCAAGR